MKLKLDIDMENSAFEDNPNELSEILADLAGSLKYAKFNDGFIKDSNGNTVGSWSIE
jgi:hypothetical protein